MIAMSIKNNVSLLHRYRTIEGFTRTYMFNPPCGVKHSIDIVILYFLTNRLAKFSNHWEAHQVFSIHIRFRAQWPAHGHINSKVKQKVIKRE